MEVDIDPPNYVVLCGKIILLKFQNICFFLGRWCQANRPLERHLSVVCSLKSVVCCVSLSNCRYCDSVFHLGIVNVRWGSGQWISLTTAIAVFYFLFCHHPHRNKFKVGNLIFLFTYNLYLYIYIFLNFKSEIVYDGNLT